MTITEFLRMTVHIKDHGYPAGYQVNRPRVECKDGFSMSVQSSEYHYCSPRINGLLNKYESVEIGFPSEKEDLILEYAEDESIPTDTVYGYVPIELVDKVLQKHGGMDDEHMLNVIKQFWEKVDMVYHSIENWKSELDTIRRYG